MKKVTISVEVRYTQIIEKKISDEVYEQIENTLGETLDGISGDSDVYDLLTEWCDEGKSSDWEVEVDDINEGWREDR